MSELVENVQEQQNTVALDKDPLDMSDEEFNKLEASPELNSIQQDQEVKQQEEVTSNGLQNQQQEEEVTTFNSSPEINQPRTPEFYKQFYDELTSPLKAVKGMVKIEDVNDLRSLVSRGLDYTRKTQEIAPYRKTLKFLQANNLLDDTKLSFLTDIYKHDKTAIKKLIKDVTSGEQAIDFYDLNPDASVDNEPQYVLHNKNTYTDSQIELENKIGSILQNEDGTDFMNHITNSLDQNSKTQIANNPDLLGDLYDLNKAGVLNKIQDKMENYKAIYYDKVNGVPDIQLMGEIIKQTPEALQVLANKYSYKPQVQAKAYTPRHTNNNVRSAVIPRSSNTRFSNQYTKDPLDMTDEEFSKAYAYLSN